MKLVIFDFTSFFGLNYFNFSVPHCNSCLFTFFKILFTGGFGEGHASSDEEELADDADATESRKKQRQQDQVK